MPYNTSMNVVRRMKRYLDDLRAHRTLTWPDPEPDVLARRVREAIAAAEHHNLVEYQDFRVNYRIHARKGFVEAEWIGVGYTPAQATLVEETPHIEPGADLRGLTIIPSARTFEDIDNLEGIVGAAITYAPEHDELHFPSAILNHEAKTTLYQWTRADGSWKFIDQEEGGVTLTRRKVDPLYLWRPAGDDLMD